MVNESVTLHLAALTGALRAAEPGLGRVTAWGERLGMELRAGRRLLAAGNGGSAAHAQHLTAELVGRYRRDRPPLSALALTAETSTLTALVNDFGPEAVFARQVDAHGRAGDTLVVISTSGRSPNLVRAAERAGEKGLRTLALCGPPGSPLAEACEEALCVPAAVIATVQEVHQVAVHLLCEAIDRTVAEAGPALASAGVIG
jgi:D-sedoheptulose 7-phosphate isomerase